MPWTDSNRVSLRYEVSGTGPVTLVLLHEMGGCLESWDHVVPLLSARWNVLRFDMRGAGGSEKPRRPFGIDDLADDLAGLLDALGVCGPVALAGCAVGAAVALHVAARMPDRVAALVAMAPATGLALDKKPDILQLAQRFEAEGVRDRILQRFDHSYPPRYFADSAARDVVRGRLLANDPHAYAATYRMLCELDMEADFACIRCPALFLAGRHDLTRPAAQVQQLAARVGGARFQVLDSGHAMNILSPQAVAGAMADFLDSLGGVSPPAS